MDEVQLRRQEMGLEDPQEIVSPKPANTPKEEEKENPEEVDKVVDEEVEEDVEVPEEPPIRGIPPKVFNKVRAEKRELEDQLEEANRKIAEFEESKAPVSEDEISSASAMFLPPNATPEQKKATEKQLKTIIALASKGGRISGTEKKELDELREAMADLKDEKIFNNDWEDFEPRLKDIYKDATKAQIHQARVAMDELAHAPQFADKEFDYVHFKNRDIFDEIFQRKSKSFESKDTYLPPEEESEEGKEFDVKTASPQELEKFHSEMAEQARKEDADTGWNIKSSGKTLT